MKRSCAAATCSRTCPSETCLSPDQTVNIDIVCWRPPFPQDQGIRASIPVKSFDNRLTSGKSNFYKIRQKVLF